MRKLYLALFSSILLFLSVTSKAQVSAYSFAESNGTYTPISGGTASTATGDDGTQNLAIGFNFNFGGTDYPNIIISTNGAVKLAPSGSTTFTTGWTNNLSNSYGSAIIAPLWDDNNATGGSVVYLLSGSAPNRTFSVEWQNIHLGGGGSTSTLTGTFKMTLYETTNVVKIEYGTINATTITSASIGLNDLTSFLSVTPGSPSTASSSAANNSISSLTALVSGLTYTFTPPSCVAPSAITPSALTQTSATVSWTASGSASSYDWEIRSSGACGSGSPLQSGTTAGTSVNLTGLTASTTYTFCIRSSCAGPSNSGWVSSSFTTVCGAANVPYTLDFNAVVTPALPSCTAVEDLNGGTTWTTVTAPTGYTGYTLRYTYSSSLPGNDWFYTQGINLTAGTSYKLKFRYSNNSTFYTESMEVKYGTSPSAGSMTNALLNYPTIIGNSPGNDSITFIPAATGVYYIGFHSYSPTDQFYLYLDDISVVELPAADISPTGISFPAVYCPSPAASNLDVTIKNTGISAIDFSSNPATVTVNVTGAVTAALSGNITTGTLAPGATTTVSVAPAFAFSNSGNYNFAIHTTAVGDGNSANDNLSAVKTINSLPATVDLGPDVNACANNGVVLNPGTQPSGSAYLWSTNATTPTITVTSSGTYSVTVTSPLLNGPGKKKFGNSNSVPVLDLQTSNSAQAVSGLLTTSMTATSVDSVCINITHTWDSDMDIQLVSPTGTVMDLSTGNGGSGDNYANTCFTATASASVTSGTAPFAGTYLPEGSFGSFAGGNPNGSWSLRVTDNFTGDQGTINSWYIVFNDSLPAAGTGCPKSDAIDVVIKPEPVVNLGADAVVCQGGTKTLDPGNQPSGSTFLWNTGATTQTIVASASGTYWVQVTNSLGCFKRDTINVTVVAPTPTTLNLPFDTLYVNSPIQSLGGGSPGGTGGVYSGSGISGTVINPAAFTQGNHNVTYTYTDQYGCVSSATDVFTIIGSSTASKVNIFPNPSQNGNLKLIVAQDLVGGMVTAYNAYGQKMQSWVIGGKLNELTLNWPAGRYILVIRNNGEEIQKQLVITR